MQLTSFSTRPYLFIAAFYNISGLVKKVIIAIKFVLLNIIVKNYWHQLFSSASLFGAEG